MSLRFFAQQGPANHAWEVPVRRTSALRSGPKRVVPPFHSGWKNSLTAGRLRSAGAAPPSLSSASAYLPRAAWLFRSMI